MIEDSKAARGRHRPSLAMPFLCEISEVIMSMISSCAGRLAALLVLGLFSLACHAQQQGFSVKTGVQYSTGEYGGTQDISDVYVPITGTLVTGSWGLSATLPYLQVRAPGGTQIGPGGEPIPGTGDMATESGIGDIIMRLTYFNLLRSADKRSALDLTGKLKLGTADETLGLGTGENDYSIQVDGYHFFDSFTLFGTLGYKVRGQPQDYVLEDVWFASIGGSVPIAPRTRLGLAFDARPSAYKTNDDLRELSVYFSRRTQGNWRYSAYLSTGFSDSSPDLGAGFSVGYHY